MAKYTAAFKKLWEESGVGKALLDANISSRDIGKIKQNISNFDMEEMPGYLSNMKRIITGNTQSDLELFHTADKLGVFNGANNAYKRLDNSINSRIAEAENKQHADNIMAAYNKGVNERVRANTERKNAKELNQFKQDPIKMHTAQSLNIDVNTVNGRKYVEQYMDRESAVYRLAKARAEQQRSAKTAKAVSAGSGQSIQEAAVPKETWSDAEKSYGIKDLDFNGKGGPSIDEAILRQKIGGDRNNWGFKKAADRRFKNVMEQVQQDHEAIIKSNMSQEEKQALWTQKRKEATDLLAEGPNIADYAFGNNLQYKGLGFAAMIGTMNVAFGGAKSNAQLYSSPF